MNRNLSVLSAELSALLLILALVLIGPAVCPSPVEAAAAGDLPVQSAADHTGFQPVTGGADLLPVTDRTPGQGLWLLAAAALLMLVFSIDN